jgi:hypothetical protein
MNRKGYALLVMRSVLWGPSIGILLLAVILSAGCSKKKTIMTVMPDRPVPVVVKEKPAPEPVKLIEVVEPKTAVSDVPIITVYFEFDKSNLLPQEAMKLDEFLGSGKLYRLVGHACTYGTEEYNLGLSEERARRVQTYMGGGDVVARGEFDCGAPCRSIDEPECEACRKVEVFAR